jgi:RNA polymerase sigma-B factor
MTERRDRSNELFAQLTALPADDPRRAQVRDELVSLHAGLAYAVARRFGRRGEHDEDVAQVAMLGLVKAVDRFDPSREVEFSTFATPTIRGEVRRYFRDSSWAVHVPRGVRELAVQVPAAAEELSARLHRSPRPSEIAAHLGVDTERVMDALDAAEAYSTVPLDSPVADGRPLSDSLGQHDAAFDRVDEREALRPLVAALPERERTILMLRFFEEMSQSQIAEQVGVSQMHVSRLLARTLTSLREGLAEAADPAVS